MRIIIYLILVFTAIAFADVYYDAGVVIQRLNQDGSISNIPKNKNNQDYKNYLNWVKQGNKPIKGEIKTQIKKQDITTSETRIKK